MTRTGLLLFGSASLLACSTLVGADFDDRNEGTRASGGQVTTSGGANTLGGQTSGGAPSGSGGAEPSSGGSSSGGTTLASGGTTGGSSGQTNTGGSSGGATASGGNVSAGQGGVGPAGSGGQDGGVGGELQGGGGAGGEPEVAGAGAGAGGEAGSGGAPGEPPVVVLNEVKGQGSGDDYVEIYNLGPGPLDLTGYLLVDQGNNDFVFPSGSSIAQGDHVLLLLGQTSPGSGPFTCFVPNHPCYHANWGISQNGETVYFRDPQGRLIDSTAYPSQSGASALTNDQTWGRVPDGSGPFRATRVTPEAVNLSSP